jgi:hypothetical protein
MSQVAGSGGGGEYVALVPDAAADLVSSFRRDADEAEEFGLRIQHVLWMTGKSAHALGALGQIAEWARFAANDLEWRIETIVKADNAVTLDGGMLGLVFAYASEHDAAVADARRLAGSSPNEVAPWWYALSPSVQTHLICNRPELIGDLVGVPVADRSAANKQKVRTRLHQLETMLGRSSSRANSTQREQLAKTIDSYKRMLRDDVTLLHYDPAGDGRAVAVLGKIEDASNIGVLFLVLGTTSAQSAARLTWPNGCRSKRKKSHPGS